MSVIATLAVIALFVVRGGIPGHRVMRLDGRSSRRGASWSSSGTTRRELVARIATRLFVRARRCARGASRRDGAPACRGRDRPADAARKEHELGDAVGSLLTSSAIAMSADVATLAKRLGEVELARSTGRGRSTTPSLTKYNRVIGAVPGNIIAGSLNFRPAELFEPGTEA